MYKQFYSRFLAENKGTQHYACHSHYFWPDVTRQAMLDYWDDSARYVDGKWAYFFDTLVPELQQAISARLNTSCPEQIVFAPNTHELLFRIISCLDISKPLHIVTTDSEFHSFYRQSNRLAEQASITVTQVPVKPIESFAERFKAAVADIPADMVFFSQVFFNSGFALNDIESIVNAVPDPDTLVVVDGYHQFMARPTDIRALESRIFYLAGSYKYAQGGEGACFAHIPKGCALRPVYTGWFAEFGALDKPREGEVSYSTDGMRFAGATMDFTALYRLRAVINLFDSHSITQSDIHTHVQSIQAHFLSTLFALKHPLLNASTLMVSDAERRGHFLAFELPDASQTAELAHMLKANGILTDYRDNRLRFGFALYHEAGDIDLSVLHK